MQPTHYPLTHAQRGVFAECMRFPDSQHYGLPMIARLNKKVDTEKLIACIEKIINTFCNYNIQLVWVDGEIRQTLRAERNFRVSRLSCADSDVDRYISQILRPFDIFNEQLVRVVLLETESEIVVLQNSHHLITDGITLTPLYTGALSKLYNEGIEPVEVYSIFDYALAQEAYDNSPEHEKTANYYKAHFTGKTFHQQTPKPSSPVGRALLVCHDIPRTDIDTFTQQYAVRPGFLLEAAYNITLSAFTRSDSVAYLTLQHGRYSRQARQAHGMFIATIPMGIDLDAQMPAIDFVRHFKGEMMSTVRRADFSLIDFLRIVGELPDTMYAYQGPQMLEKINLGGEEYSISQIRIADNTTASFSVVVYETDQAYQLRLECSDAFMDQKMLHDFASSMKTCVKNIIATPEAAIKDIQITPAASSLPFSAGLPTPNPQNQKTNPQPPSSILTLLKDNNRTAIVAPNGSLTYSELTAGANAVACHLAAEGVKEGDFVAIQTDRGYEFVVAIMGIMLAGAAYVPIDSSYPQERKDYMLKDSHAVMNLTSELVRRWLKSGELKVPTASSLPFSAGLPPTNAYMIYTSGSTGKPKGVVISHAALASFVDAITQVLGISAEDRISCHSSFSFDASVEDIFPILKAGGTLYIVPESLRRDLPGLAEWLNENHITGGNYTTRFGQLLLAEADLPHLRYLVVGGEKMTTYPERNRHLRLFNTYGPTECTVDATYHELTADTDVRNIPIGTPLPGVSATVRDHHGRLLPFGIEGELWLSGTQLAEGYWLRDELTARSFVTTADGVRYYRTGDIVRWNDCHQLIYLRRDDGQVKLNGYRIELADVEAQLLNHPHIFEAKALVVKNATDILCAYYTSDAEVSESDLRSFLLQQLPSYMVPSAFVRLEQMPVNVVGKLDVSQLPKPSAASQQSAASGSPEHGSQPLTHDEQLLLDIARRVTGFHDISVTDSLLQLGITSMQLIQMAMEANKEGLRIKMESVSETSSIRDIASAITTTDKTFCWIDIKNKNGEFPLSVIFCGTTSAMQMRQIISKAFITASSQPSSAGLAGLHKSLLFLPISDNASSLDTIVRNAVETIRSQVGDRQIRAFIGHSFGGEIAYRVAKEWYSITSQTSAAEQIIAPELIMLDTTLKLPAIPQSGSDILALQSEIPHSGSEGLAWRREAESQILALQSYLDSMPEEQRLFWEEYYRKALLASRLHDESQLTGYQGKITLYNALQRDKMFLDLLPVVKNITDDDGQLQEWAERLHNQAMSNSTDWQAIHPDITIINADVDHYWR